MTVFVSHSRWTPAGREAFALVQQVVAELGLDVTSDAGDELRTGERFPDAIHRWTAECLAAVVLIDEESIGDSNWVPYEVARLEMRAAAGEIQLIPVLIGDGALAALEARPEWVPMHFTERLAVRYLGGTFARDLQRVLEPTASALRRRRQHGRIYDEIVDHLLVMPRALIDRMLERVGIDRPVSDWSAAHALGATLLESPDPQSLVEVVLVLALHNRGLATSVFEAVLPRTWITELQAEVVREVLRDVRPDRVVGVNGRHAITCEMLLHRASPMLTPAWTCFTPAVAHLDEATALAGSARAALLEVCGLPEDFEISNDELDMEASARPTCMVLRPPAPDRDLLRPVRRAFPHLIIFLLGTEDGDLDRLGLAGERAVRPPIELTVETTSAVTHARTIRRIHQVGAGTNGDGGR